MGHFQPGVEGGLGRGRFDAETAGRLRKIKDTDGLLVNDPAHPDDLANKVFVGLECCLSTQLTPFLQIKMPPEILKSPSKK